MNEPILLRHVTHHSVSAVHPIREFCFRLSRSDSLALKVCVSCLLSLHFHRLL